MNPLHERLGAALDGDAARYNGDEFADARLGSVLGSVKRRRTARAAGVSSVSLVGASALAVGAANVPWGSFVLGASPAGSPSVFCTTTTPDAVADASTSGAADSADYLVILQMGEDTPPTSETSPDGITKSDPGTPGSVSWAVTGGNDPTNVAKASMDGDTLVVDTPVEGTQRVNPSADGSYHFTLNGNVVVWTISDDDQFEVTLSMAGSDGVTGDAPPPAASSSPSVDCVTTTPEPSASASNSENPSPTPSSSPAVSPSATPAPTSSLEASSDEVFSPTPISGTTPFQCGFEFPSGEHAADTFSVTGGKVPASQMQALLTEKVGAKAPTLNADSAYALMWRGKLVGDASASSVNAAAAESLSYVLAVDGIVIGTFDKDPDGAMDGVSVARESDSASPEAFLWDKHGATLCPGVTGTVINVQTWVVAGSTSAGEPIYAWKNITKD